MFQASKTPIYVGLICVIAVVGGAFTYALYTTSGFPPTNVLCFEAFRNSMENNQSDFSFPEFSYSKVDHFRCASTLGFDQYEIQGKDKSGESFYLHKVEGGLAASGADSYLDVCYIKDGRILYSRKIVGRSNMVEQGTCVWTEGFPTNATSKYEMSTHH